VALKRIKSGWQVYVYDPRIKRKRYVGVRAKHGDAKDLEREALRDAKGTPRRGALTIREYALQWLDDHHGAGTRRPSPTTRQVNELNLRRFIEDHGDKALDAITRREALRWAKQNRHRAKTVSAMYNDAVDDEDTAANPFGNRRAKQSDERKLIAPLTEAEIDTLAGLALDRWGRDGYGQVARAWVLFGAWVGTRPGETFSVTWQDLDLRDGLVTVRRIKGRRQTDTIVLPSIVVDAIQLMPRVPSTSGLVFPTVNGKRVEKGSLRYYWDPVRSAFRATTTQDRWDALCEGQPDLDFYVLRHFCASLIVARGGNEYDVAAQLGNTPEVCRRTYIHSYEDQQRDRLRGLLERPEPVVDITSRRSLGGNRGGK
jgi:integrase